MIPYKAVLIDDEQKLIQVLKIKLKQTCPELEIIAEANNAQEGYEIISEKKPDIVFLDIGMPGESGFEMLQRFDDIDFEIIFVTGYNDYALKAIQFCAIGYVLKPINSEELRTAVEHAIVRMDKKISKQQYEYFFEQLNNPELLSKRIGLTTIDGIEFVKIKDIIRCETNGRHTVAYLADKTKIMSNYKLGKLYKLLQAYHFFMPHKSHLVNLSHALKYDKEGLLIMSDGTMVPLSRRKKADFFIEIEKIT